MESVSIRELFCNTRDYTGKTVTVSGWVRSVRASKAFGFIVLHDGTFFSTLQVVYHDNLENFQEISKMNVGAALVVTGTVVETPEAKQPFELQAESIVVEGSSASKAAQFGVPSNHDAPPPPDQHLPSSLPGPEPDCLCHPPVLPRA